MEERLIAHSANPQGREEAICDHLRDVSNRAAEFASAFGASEEASMAGMLHDLGKYSALFQRRVRGLPERVDHSSAGAWAAWAKYGLKGLAACLAIQGHHGGMRQASTDALRELNPERPTQTHPNGLKTPKEKVDELLRRLTLDGGVLPSKDELPDSLFPSLISPHVGSMLDVRMLFSALVDADYLETEAHFNGTPDGSKTFRDLSPQLRAQWALSILLGFVETLAANSGAESSVKETRAALLQACLAAADRSPGLFTLTAPTGSGKTLAMLAFALQHAWKHSLRRVVMVIPYLSIIEQTVGKYREVFSQFLGDKELGAYLLEHHSLAGTRIGEEGLSPEDDDSVDVARRNARMLAENWDAPIIVTTSVQFLESLFSNKPSACRKLHRLAGSVILLDEVQTMGISLAVPTLAALSRLAERYRASVVFSTATQPAFQHLDHAVRPYCRSGWQPREIVPNPDDLFARVRRTTVRWPSNLDVHTTHRELAERLSLEEQVLCIVNLKRHALAVHRELEQLQVENLFHLSTNMCPAHRSRVLESVRSKLSAGEPCRLVSTQCVEAGVDVDFPVVYRALGPLDAIAQAAGRCNREGKASSGDVFVFVPESEDYPDRAYRQAASVTRILLEGATPEGPDIHDLATFSEYYRELYDLAKPENANKPLLEALKCKQFQKVASLYRVIGQDSINVLVPYDVEYAKQLEREVRETRLTRDWIAKARPHCISLFRPRPDHPVFNRLDPLLEGKNAFPQEWFVYTEPSHYNKATGLVIPDSMDCIIA